MELALGSPLHWEQETLEFGERLLCPGAVLDTQPLWFCWTLSGRWIACIFTQEVAEAQRGQATYSMLSQSWSWNLDQGLLIPEPSIHLSVSLCIEKENLHTA